MDTFIYGDYNVSQINYFAVKMSCILIPDRNVYAYDFVVGVAVGA